jgi:predicted neutral ceramidase superfamily lipid hydrolase
MHYREILSVFAIAFTLIAFAPYIRSIIKDKIKPHVFSWFIWGSTTFVVFLAQLEDNAGAGAWPIGVSGSITIFVVFLAYVKRADISITKTDWLFLISAISSLPLWYFTSDPLWAVIILTVVDVLGFGPTVRKAYFMPHSESLLFFALFTARNLIVILALENYSVTTVLFPAVIAAVCTLLLVMIFYRRRASLP